MNKIEQMHLDTMIVKDLQSAFRSADITEQIAIEFAHYYFKETFNETLYSELRTTEQIFQEFLKTKEK